MKKLLLIIALVAVTIGANAQTNTQSVSDRTKHITSGLLWPNTTYTMKNTIVDGRLTAGNIRTDGIYMTTENGSFIDLGKSQAIIGSNLRLTSNGTNNSGGNLTIEGTTTFSRGKASIDLNGNFKTDGSFNVNGKTNINGTNGNILTEGVFNANGKAFVDGTNGSITATGVMNANGGLKVFNGAQITGGLNMQNSKITRVVDGTEQYDAVNKGQLDKAKAEVNDKITTLDAKVDKEVSRLDGKIDAETSERKSEISRVDSRIDATNQAVSDLDSRVTTEVTRLDGKINTESAERKSEIARVDSRIDQTNTNLSNLSNTVSNNATIAANATAKVQSNLDAESTSRKKADEALDKKIDKTANDSKLYTDAERDRAMAAEKALDGKINAETLRALAAEARLDTRISTLSTRLDAVEQQFNNRLGGVASMAMAMGASNSAAVYNKNKRNNFTMGSGFYGRQSAIAIGLSRFLTSTTRVSVNYSSGTFTKVGVGVGFGAAF